ncbi:MAG: bifunctional UDP-N-acetylglucosamine diphosphorylase/glucosamine-1-phosphate N-acetyltransferase GlmU [Candidatus Solibacter usitatus]|nr:bifunctional UDP-N-acetylglucosamine diphosphorylase/glucosamine-1-phosphate N-acetyltransferase GlmU [Candidatus Solibacter usitatus]
MPSLTILILAAGLGTRMKSKQAKVLHRAGGKSLVEHVVDSALELTAPDHVCVVVGHQAEKVQEVLASRGVRFVRQTEQQGTGHAVLCCEESATDKTGRVIVLYGDVPLLSVATLRRLLEMHDKSGAAAVAITTIVDDPYGYGRIVRNQAGDVTGIVEHKAATDEQRRIREINAGIYSFDAPLLWRHLHDIGTANPAGEYYLTDMVEILNANGHRVAPLVVEDPSELLGINTRVELALIDKIMRDRAVREHMLAGVTIERPETVTIDAGVRIGQDTVIEPFARLLGTTVIGGNCHVGACSILENARLDDGATVLAFTMVADSHLATGARVGPYSRLRMNAEIESGAVIGNFVELKKTRMGKGAKAQHLAYLGDSTIGAKANIGAGTITCNYDGRRKHETHIGAGAFIGSNSTLVAPIEIGDGSYVGAGSVLTDAVPEDALALGRARQTVKAGWAKAKREEK